MCSLQLPHLGAVCGSILGPCAIAWAAQPGLALRLALRLARVSDSNGGLAMAEASTNLTWTRMTSYHGDSGKAGVLPGRSWDHSKMGDRVKWKDSQRRRDIHCLRDEGQRKHKEKRDVKMFMNEKARDRERTQCTHTRKWWRRESSKDSVCSKN